jgi:Ca-activated chloride channel family protein
MVWWIAVILVTSFAIYHLRRTSQSAVWQIPFVIFGPGKQAPKAIKWVSFSLYVLSLFFATWAFVHFSVGSGPLTRFLRVKTTQLPEVSKVLFFVIDRSGSMAEPMPGNEGRTKMTVVQEGLKKFITEIDAGGGEYDLLGLITFARAAIVEMPLSLNRRLLLEKIQSIVPETVEHLNGTAIGYAIFKTVSLIVACRELAESTPSPTGQALIVITDGIEEPNPADRQHPYRFMRFSSALNTALENQVRVHYINIDKNSYQQLRLDERDRMRELVQKTGGTYAEVSTTKSLSQIIQEIADLEITQKITTPSYDDAMAQGFMLIMLSLLSLCASRLLDTAVVRVTR